MNLHELVNVSIAVASTRSRLKKRAALAECLRAADEGEIELVVNYLGGVMAQGRIGLGPATVSSALKAAAAGSDLVPLVELNKILDDIASQSGDGSKRRKEALFGALLNRVAIAEQQFLAGLVLGEIRQGALEGMLVDAIANATGLPATGVRRAVMLAADPAPVAKAALTFGASGLEQFQLEPLKPVRPMLATPAENIDDAMTSLGEAVLQVKLDGARVQVHRVDGEVRIFTRQMNEVTERLPEIVETVSALPVTSLILDGEAIAINEKGRPLPFQVTMRRFGRSSNIVEMRKSLPLSGIFFDCLYVNGEARIDEPLNARLETLSALLPDEALVDQLTTADAGAASRFLARAYDAGHEGLMAKAPTSVYAAGNRGAEWLKI
ncbi:MAG: ATP-dependent DNA ligase, partial [Pseudomonadota bacterium]